MAKVELKNLRKVYPHSVGERAKKSGAKGNERDLQQIDGEDAAAAVENFTLEIKDKEFIVLVGPSGCGKSTVLRMIAGLETITDGELYIDGMLSNAKSPKDRDIAMVFQNYALYPQMKAFDNMAFSMKLRKRPKREIREKVRDAAGILEILDYLDRKPRELSGGQRQRVAIGRAIVRMPKVFLMDEPLSNLDAKLRNQMRAEIIKLRKRIDTTFVYVTHDQIEAMTLGDRIVVMRDGLIQQVGTPQEVFYHPANMFVAGFIGLPQMNFFRNARLVHSRGRYSVDCLGSRIVLPEEKQAALAATRAREQSVVVGVRPVHIMVGEEGIPARVDFSELLGSETHLHLNVECQDVIAVASTIELREKGFDRNRELCFSFDPALMHVFSVDTEQNLA